MRIRTICFTKKGMETSLDIRKALAEYSVNEQHEGIGAIEDIRSYAKYENAGIDVSGGLSDITVYDGSVQQWAHEGMRSGAALIFIGAMGIAVRAVAGSIQDKLTDSPVLVVDELATYVIPVLSGHVGGANKLAHIIAEALGAHPVITTATDIEGAFSPDLFAVENNLSIMNKDGIAKVSSKALSGKPIRISIENYPPSGEDICDVVVGANENYIHSGVLNLCPKQYAVGIGCRKGTDSGALSDFVRSVLEENCIDARLVGAIASIDVKSGEQALIDLSYSMRVPFITFTKEQLLMARGEYEESEFVMQQVGVGNVCERAAMVLTGNAGTIVVKKRKYDGMTIAVAKINSRA